MPEPVITDLDVRPIPPREKHPTIFAKLGALQLGESLRIFNDHDPKPLRYQLLAEYPDQFAWEPEKQGPEEWIIRIRRLAS